MRSRLHDWRIAPREYTRQEQRRGRRHAFERLSPARTALVAIDMVPFFVSESAYCRGIVPNINRLADALRSLGGTTAWVVPAAGHRHPALAAEFYGKEIAALFAATAGNGPLPDRLWPELDARAGDLFVEKAGASAFFPGASPLPALLCERGIDTVLITGTVTNVCCESSARDAHSLGLRVVMVADANAARRDEDHNASLHTIYRSFGDVRPTSEVLELISVLDAAE